MEYLNKDDLEDQLRLLHPTPPASPLIVDSVSGIYLGFDEVTEYDEDTKKENTVVSTSNVSKYENEGQQPRNHTKPETRLRNPLFRSRQSSKYKVSSQSKSEGNICFRLLRKVWGKADICK